MPRCGRWRRRTPATALAHWRAVRERLFREHPQSPIPVAARADFRALHFDHDPLLRFHAVVEPAPPPEPGALPLELPNSGADSLSFSRIGRVRLPFPDGERTLSVFWMAGYAGGIFIPFRDATNGHIDLRRWPLPGRRGEGRGPRSGSRAGPANWALILDFNFALSRRAPSTRGGRVRSRHPRTASTSRSVRVNG